MAMRVPESEADAIALGAELTEKARRAGVPEGLIDGLVLYAIHGYVPGSFLRAVLSNNLTEAFNRADRTSQEKMFSIVSFVYNDLPAGCWGSMGEIERWAMHRGLTGMPK